MPRRHGVWLGVALAMLAPMRGASQEPGFPVHYVVFSLGHADWAEWIEPQFYRSVSLREPLRSQDDDRIALLLQQPSREADGVVVRLLDRDGRTVFQDVTRVERWLRGEFHDQARPDGSWTIEGHRFLAEERSFAVRVPVIAGTRLALELPAEPGLEDATAVFDLDALRKQAARLPLGGFDVAPKATLASSGNRVDLLILGDGYTAAEQAKFEADAASLESSFFGIAPYDVYRNYVNVNRAYTASVQSGADHPPYNAGCSGDNPACCSDSEAIFDPKAGTYVTTAFDARYCAFNIHRLLVVSSSKVLAFASSYPDWDRILVLVNDTTYGGAGGYLAVASTNPYSVDVARHEYGHSFTGLADEYDSAYPGFPACSDVSGSSPCEANVTNQTTRSLIKWNPWILASTPVPTPEGNALYADATGLFTGARYQTSGMYRHEDTHCLMLGLGQPFGEVCGQEYILRLYRGGWGTPSSGIDPIEPGLESPPPGTVSTVSGVHLSAPLLSPAGGPPLQVIWKVDGAVVPGILGSTFDFFRSAAGTHQVRLEVKDVTTRVQPAMAGTDLQSSRQWTVVASGPAPADFYTLTPCRVLDTRNPDGPYGGPELAAGSARSFALAGRCGIPATARAVMVNVTAVGAAQSGYLTLHAPDGPVPNSSAINFVPASSRANNGIVMLAQDGHGTLSIRSGSSGSVDVVVDVSGYFQ
jgi:IgA Peptidase M64